MAADLGISLAILAGIVLLSEVMRRVAAKVLGKSDYLVYVWEIISTLQLCSCTHELKLLGEVGRVDLQIGLTLTYLISVVHGLTFRGAICNPSSTIESVYRSRITGGSATGAVFNPALAFSTQFSCSGNTFAEYSLVYWLGPVLGMTGSVLLYDKVIPSLSRKSTHQNGLDSNGVDDKKKN
ncbi:aquaporin-11 isoform X2 [Engraulis encrasicolus]|uniref:aquaporin-11 isoform X2 n=1 Tax=Engraulis encrasicolus TaxID=184585 RepID=UPI002FD25884